MSGEAQRLEETLFAAWQSYEKDVIPPSAPNVQREESRRAFYAGALSAYGLTLAACAPEDEDECERRLEALGDEISGIVKDLRL